MKIIKINPACGCRVVEDKLGFRHRDRICNWMSPDGWKVGMPIPHHNPKEGYDDDWYVKEHNNKIKEKLGKIHNQK